jgi:hypothetical protein
MEFQNIQEENSIQSEGYQEGNTAKARKKKLNCSHLVVAIIAKIHRPTSSVRCEKMQKKKRHRFKKATL